jgi:hypothetical protein
MTPPNDPSSGEAEFQNAVLRWREKHQLQESDPVFHLLELFQLHQRHWDALRKSGQPSAMDYEEALERLAENIALLGQSSETLLRELRSHTENRRMIQPALVGLLLTAFFSTVTGIFIGRFLL